MAAVGSSTGLDVNGIVSQLIQLERRPLQALAQRETQVTARIAAYSRVQGAVSSLQNAATALARATSFSTLRATASGDSASAAVSDSAKATEGSYTLKVNTLATAQAMASAPGLFTASTDVVGTGRLTLQVGAGAPKTIDITAANQTLAGVRDAINAAKAGVTAAIVTAGGQARLTLAVSETGAANTISLTAVDDDGGNADLSGLSRLASANLEQTRAASNASFEINGLALTSPSNKLADALAGVSIDLRKEGTSTITIARDNGAASNLVNAFIKAYNDLDKIIDEVTAYDPVNRRGAVLNGDSAIRSLQSQVRGLLRATMNPAQAGDLGSLSQLGIEQALDGSISLNAKRFEEAMTDPARVARLFSATSDVNERDRGFGVRFQALARSIVGTDGMLPARTKGLQAQIDQINKQEERLNTRLLDVEKRLRRQYTALDTQLQNMQSTSNTLENALKQLPGASKDG